MSNATDMLQQYLDAEKALLAGQAFKWGDQQLTRADLGQIQAGRREWQRAVNAENAAAAGRTPGVSLADFGCGR